MAKQWDCILYMRHVQLEVTIPEKFFWEFADEFGKKFAIDNPHAGASSIKELDHYFDHPGGWHAIVTVWENQEDDFYNFMCEFTDARKLSWRDPRIDKD